MTYPRGEVRRITNDVNYYGDVSLGVTANDSALVTVQEEAASNLWVVPGRDAARAKKITAGSGIVAGARGLAWTPDASTIVYSSLSDGASHIWSADRNGGHQRQLTFATRDETAPVVTPDGGSILFCSSRTGTSNVWKMDLDGKNLVRMTTTEDYYGTCSPDSKWLVYAGFGSGYDAIWKKPMSGGDAVQLTTKISFGPAVSPDGSLLACSMLVKQGDRPKIALLPFGGTGSERYLDKPLMAGSELHWSTDGKDLLYTRTDGDVSNIWAQPIDGSPARRVTNFTEDRIFAFDLSRDGNDLLCARGSVTSDVVLITGFR
jgi:TolB protein